LQEPAGDDLMRPSCRTVAVEDCLTVMLLDGKGRSPE
jgi:hypothetical protein